GAAFGGRVIALRNVPFRDRRARLERGDGSLVAGVERRQHQIPADQSECSGVTQVHGRSDPGLADFRISFWGGFEAFGLGPENIEGLLELLGILSGCPLLGEPLPLFSVSS